MPVAEEERVALTVSIPQSVLKQIEELARDAKTSREREFESLLRIGLKTKRSYQDRFDRLSETYRARLAREGKLNQTFDEIMEELARVREQVANELYPD